MSTPGPADNFGPPWLIGLIRVALVLLGGWMLAKLTGELVREGHITYSMGEVGDEQVVTRTLPEALAVWTCFASFMTGLIILGAAPHWYARYPWLWKALLATAFGGYVLGNLLR